MARRQISSVRMAIAVLCSICAIMLFAACQGVSSSGGAVSISGKILSINAGAHSVTLQGSINGQQQTITVSNLTDQQIAALQGHLNSNYSFQVSQNNNTYTIVSNTNPVSQDASTTPEATSNTASVLGNISFIGTVRSFAGNSLTVSMPDGNTLTMNITNNTDRHDMNGAFQTGTQLKVDAFANPDGSFQASSLKTINHEQMEHNNDLNTVSYEGVTTSTVGQDHLLHFKVGNQSFTALIGYNTQLKDLNGSAQNITSNQRIKVDVLFNGGTGNALKVEPNSSNNN